MTKLKLTNPLIWMVGGWLGMALPTIIHYNQILEQKCYFYDSYLNCLPASASGNLLNAIYLAAVFGILWVAYLELWQNGFVDVSWRRDWPYLAIIGVCALITVPIGTFDLFYYYGASLAQITHGINPYVQSFIRDNPFATQFSFGEVGGLMYFPIWLAVSKGIVLLSQQSMLVSVYLYKLLMGACLVVSAGLIWLCATRLNLPRPTTRFWLFVLNPLLIFESFVNGHMEALMMVAILIGMYLLLQSKLLPGFLALTSAVLIKVTAVLVIPFWAIWYVLQDRTELNKRVVALGSAGILCLMIVAVFFLPYWVGFDTLNGLKSQSRWINNSIFSFFHALAAIGLTQIGRPEIIDHALPRLLQLGLGLIFLTQIWRIMNFLWQTWQQQRSLQFEDVVKLSAVFLLMFFLFIQRSFLPWYVVVPFGLILLIPDWSNWPVGKAMFIWTVSSSGYYIIQSGFGYGQMADYRLQAIAAITIFGPLLAILVKNGYLWKLRRI